jgi:hypothetical protein
MKRGYAPEILSALVVVLLTAGYAAFVFLALKEVDVTNAIRIIIALAALFVIGGVGWALVSRIRELKGGQEDDLGKY